jgi:hypothetical protein
MTARASGRVRAVLPVEERPVPSDLTAEGAVLCASMLDVGALDVARLILKPEHFFSEAHRRIFEALVDLREKAEKIDTVQVGTWLKDRGRLAQVGGMGYLAEILTASPAVDHVDAHARSVVEKALLREVIAACERWAAEGRLDIGEIPKWLSTIEESFRRISETLPSRPRPPSPFASKLVAVSAEWFTRAPPARPWLLRDSRRPGAPGVLPLGKVGQLIAPGGVGKTMTIAQLGCSVSTGAPWLGTFSVAPEGKGRVLLVLGEEDAEEAQRRLYNASKALGVPTPDPGAVVVLPLAGVPCAMLERDERSSGSVTTSSTPPPTQNALGDSLWSTRSLDSADLTSKRTTRAGLALFKP